MALLLKADLAADLKAQQALAAQSNGELALS